MGKINEILKDVGFNEREIRIYLTLLKKGSSTVLIIAKEAQIDRTTTYDILEKLIAKGIVSYSLKNNAKHFSVLTPEKLVTYFKEKYSSLENILPELKKITNQTQEKIKCELFYGKEGLKTVGRDIANKTKEYYVIGIRKEYEEILGYFNKQAIIRLNQFKAKEYAIVEKDAKFKKLKRGEYRYIDKKLLATITTLIYKNKVVFFIWKEPYFAVRIENEELVKAQKEYFDLLWDVAR